MNSQSTDQARSESSAIQSTSEPLDDSRRTASGSLSRRQFHRSVVSKTAAASLGAAAGFHFFPGLANKRLEKPTLAGIGAGGKGRTDIQQAQQAGFEVVALVDVIDAKRLQKIEGRLKSMAEVREAYSNAAFYQDYREMLADLGDQVDAVTVSTPDHHHFHASIMAMQQGKHVYCQKPLTHSIWEARMMNRVAEQCGVQTQMGNQAHANDHLRRCVELVRAGLVGKVKEIHAWTNRPIWPQGFAQPPASQSVPDFVDWQQWVGPAPWVEYSPLIAPFAWRGWWNYGTGALGDMACHIMDMGYWAMNPTSPLSVKAQQFGATELSPPINSIITWEFGPTPHSSDEGFTYKWYDGYIDARFDREKWKLIKNGNAYNHPDDDVLDGRDFKQFGSVIIGTEGKLFFNRGKNNWEVSENIQRADFESVPLSIPRAPEQNNYQEWLAAIEGKVEKGQSNFSLAGPMTETILLGVLAQRAGGETLKWDGDRMEVVGRPEFNQWIRRDYRNGWEIKV